MAVEGFWQKERHCGDCGNVEQLGTPQRQPPQRPVLIEPGPNCTGYYNGRPKNRCGWPISIAWVFSPKGGRGGG